MRVEAMRKNMTTSSTKTKKTVISRQARQHSIVVYNSEIEQVDRFKHLGAVISVDGGSGELCILLGYAAAPDTRALAVRRGTIQPLSLIHI